MYIIGERINGMFKDVRRAIVEKDKQAIQNVALAQVKANAQVLDLNVGPASDKPIEAMMWLVNTVREVTDVPLSIDSPKWELQKEVVPNVPGHAIINSCKADEAELERYVALAVEKNASLIALTIDEKGVPSDAEKRVELGALITTKAMEGGLPMDRFFIDPIIIPVNAAPAAPANVLNALQQLRLLSSPPPRLLLGLSNVSQGCNERRLINRTYLVMALTAGMDSVILDPLDTELMNAGITTELLLQKTIYCDSFLEAYRMRGA